MKRKLVVLPVLALVLLIIMLILEFSNIGSDFEYFWEEIKNTNLKDWKMIPILFFLGILIGLIPFYKISKSHRMVISTSIVFIIFSSYYLIKMFIFCFGLYDDFNYFKAINDLQNGKIQLLYAGQYYYSCDEEYNAIDSLYKSYGIITTNIGIITPGMYRYNAVVKIYLSNKCGENWNEKFVKQVDSIRNIYSKE
ncbi:MAG: hypothetical protein LBE37_16455 [Sphingobacterium sp.]|jgi:hypothetical protein|nr:hypothetical protein [Sphingobacterium sp.]